MLSFKKSSGEVKEVEITVSTRTFLRLAALTVGVIIFLLFLAKASHALALIFIAFFLALALNAPVHFVSKHLPGRLRGSRSLGTTLAFLIVVILLGAFIASILPPLIKQTQGFVKVAPSLVSDFRDQDSQTGRFIREHKLEKHVDSFSEELSERLKGVGGEAFSTVQRVGSSAFALLTILVMTFMMLVEGPRWLKFAKEVTPDKHNDMSERLAKSMYGVIKGYVNGQVVLAAIAAILIMPVILILDIGYPVALLVIVFVCGLIPMVGHTIGAIIVTIVALFHSLPAAIIILAYYILYQQLENIFVQPRIQANTTNMSPLLVFASLIVGVSFGGLIGGLVAIPIAGCIRIVLLEYLRQQKIIGNAEFKEITTETK